LKFYAITDIGKKRKLNEDSIYTTSERIGILPNLFIVADGMGGHNAGDYASQHTVVKLVEVISAQTAQCAPQQILEQAIEQANDCIYQRACEDSAMSGMGTTLVMTVCEEKEALVANIGDSRLYLIRDGISQITKDHSVVEEMVNFGVIDREMARNHPKKNVITRALGVKETVSADFFRIVLEPQDKLLICTDGLTNMVSDEEIYRIICDHTDVEQAAKALVEAANDNGGRDNISVVLIEPFGGRE